MYNEFFNDYSTLKDKLGIDLNTRGYRWILDKAKLLENKYLDPEWKRENENVDMFFPNAIFRLKKDLLANMYSRVNIPSTDDSIVELFGGTEWENKVRYMNLVNTLVRGRVVGMYIIDGYCNLFTSETGRNVLWYSFDASLNHTNMLLESKVANGVDWNFAPGLI